MQRIRSIDVFRGIAIVLMVFFTLLYVLSADVPELLEHNVRGEFHIGDLVLPMFIFASGMSIVFFVKKREHKKRSIFFLDVFERFAKLVFVSILLSPFTASGFFGMDVIMLSALVFLGALVVFDLKQEHILALVFCIFAFYVILQLLGITPIWAGVRLGGYPAAFFYLPVMLSGMLLGKLVATNNYTQQKIKKLFLFFTVLFVLFSYFTSVDKLSASPGFMLLSILISILLFSLINKFDSQNILFNVLAWLGKKPLRYWVMMFLFFVIPLIYYGYVRGTYPLDFHWSIGIGLSMLILVALGVLSFILDKLESFVIMIRRNRT